MSSSAQIPQYVTNLRTFYGQPSQDLVLGIVVFYEQLEPAADIEQVALRYYREFIGVYWERFGETTWMQSWQKVYERAVGQKPDIVSELNAVVYRTYVSDRLSNLLRFDSVDDCETAQQLLAAAYDDPDVTDLRIYEIGDSSVMQGLLIIGYRLNGETTAVVLLVD
jgi:hypothetical protein